MKINWIIEKKKSSGTFFTLLIPFSQQIKNDYKKAVFYDVPFSSKLVFHVSVLKIKNITTITFSTGFAMLIAFVVFFLELTTSRTCQVTHYCVKYKLELTLLFYLLPKSHLKFKHSSLIQFENLIIINLF